MLSIYKYRIAIVEWVTPFGVKVKSPSVQMRVGFFWWVTLTHCESINQAKYYIKNIKNKEPEKVIEVKYRET